MAAWGKRVSAASSVGDFGEARVRSIEFRLFFATLHEKPLDDKHVEVRGLAAHGSVLFTAGKEPDIGASIEYIIALGGPSDQRVSLRCIGKVLRANRSDSGESDRLARS